MSHMPRAVPRTAAADCQRTDIHSMPTAQHSTTSFPVMNARYVPLSQRTADQLQANADELRRMAATAGTTDVAKALLTLAGRYAALAAKRRGAGGS